MQIKVNFDNVLYKRLLKHKEEAGIPMSFFIRSLVKEYFEKKDKEMKDKLGF